MDDLQGRVPLNKNLGLAEGSVYIEEVWESSASEAGNSGMEAGVLSRNEVIQLTETGSYHNVDIEKTALTKNISKKERQWIRRQNFIKKQSDGEIRADM